ncbi:MAG: GDYXXLXY domain-containing protein [Planctomycetaceae bacterium]|nr:GDYXXLXY domain-containing protein [Planctomycetaceae bacterium]
MRKSTIVLLLSGIFSLIYVNGIAWRYATIRNEGNLVYLELAPVDPISLVQGQYMRLRFAIEREDAELRAADQELFAQDPNARVLAVLKLDSNRVGTVSRLIPGNPADSIIQELKDEYGPAGYALLTVEVDGNLSSNDPSRKVSIKLQQNSFLFEENTPERYNNARYGIFRVTSHGEYVLVDLAGERFEAMTAVKKPLSADPAASEPTLR